MGLSASSVWEVRPTVGNDTNGGGFVTGASGTDFSQQNAKNSGGNNGSTTDAVGAGTTTITSATASFTSAIVGNIIFLSGGSGSLAAGWYQVTTFTNATTIVVDRTVATGTGITMNIGGAFSTIANAYTPAIGGNTIYVKASGSNTVTTTLTLSATNNTGNGPITAIGYTTTRTDNGQATWTTATNNIDILHFHSASGYVFQNFIFSSTAGTPGNIIAGDTSGSNSGALAFDNCVFTGGLIGLQFDFNANFTASNLYLSNCVIKSCTSHGISSAGTCQLVDCYIHDNTGDGIRTSTFNASLQGHWSLSNCIIYNNGGKGINDQRTDAATGLIDHFALYNCDIVSNTSDGYATASTNGRIIILQNCIFAFNGGWGINFNSVPAAWICKNLAFFSNTSGNRNNFSVGSGSDVILTGDPFVAKGSNNFALNNTAGAGAACKAAGYPGVLQSGGTGFIDIGALQSQCTGGSSGYQIQLGDTIQLSDSFSLILVMLLTFSDTITLTDSVIVGFISQQQSASDSLNITDGVATNVIIGFGPPDALSLSDSMQLGYGIQFTDTLSLSDALAIVLPLSRLFRGDVIVLSDQFQFRLTQALSTPADSITLSDSLVVGNGNIYTDTLALSDAAVVTVNTNLTESLSDTLTLSDNVATLNPNPLNNYLRRYLNDVVN